MHTLYPLYLAVSRWVLPALAVLIALFWTAYFRASRPEKRTLARFVTRDGVPVAVTAAEGFIGRRRTCDVQLPVATVSKKHALFYQQDGKWMLAPLQGEVWINEQPLEEPAPILDGDLVAFADQELFFECNDPEQEDISSFTPPTGGLVLLFLTLFQLVLGGQLCLRYFETLPVMVPIGFAGLIALEWLYFLAGRFLSHFHMLAEIPVLFLTTLGLAVCVCASPESLTKQLFCIVAGAVGALLLTLLLRRQELCYRLRYVFAGITLAVMWFTVLFGTKIFGSRNWLSIAGVSFQPSEFAKVAFLLVGSCALYISAREPFNRWFFMGFAALIMGALVLMVDFGAIAIFFFTMLILLLMRLTDWRLVAGIAGCAVGAGTLVLVLYPHIAQRFGAWMHVWEYASSTGYQQTRTLIAAASGGLLGVGGGNGTLLSVAAADTDLVFGVLCEEWGSIIALCAALCFVALAVYARRLAADTKSAFYAIGVCGAAGMMLFQTALNLFGSTDLLPLTGVTMMFVSRGGTSLVAAFLLIAFFKAAEVHPSRLETERRRYY